jgi:hypothetical protein
MGIVKTIMGILYNLEIKYNVQKINRQLECVLWDKTANVQKIHFIYRMDKRNAGDMSCCPLFYSQWGLIPRRSRRFESGGKQKNGSKPLN